VLPTAGHAVTVQTFPVPSPAADLQQIVAGPDNTLWFTEQAAGNVGRITTAGQITEYPIPNNASGLPDTGPTQIVASGGGLWFLTDIGESVYRMATDGTSPPVYANSFFPASNLAPSDTGGVWLMESFGDGKSQDGDALLRVDPNATVTGYSAIHPNHIDSIAQARDGSVWFNNAGGFLYRLTDAGAQLSYPLSLPTPNEVSSIAFAPGGLPWFTDYAPNSLTGSGCCGGVGELAGGVAHLTPIGSQRPADGIEPGSLTLGPDGAMCFAFHKAWSGAPTGFDGIGRVDPATGGVQLVSTDPYVPTDIAFGSDSALWFVDSGANVVGRIEISTSLFSGGGGGSSGSPRAPAIRLTLPAEPIAGIRRTGTLRIGCQLAGAGRCSVSATITAAVARQLGLKPARQVRNLSLAHRSVVLRRSGSATITLHLPSGVLYAIGHAHKPVPVTLTGVSSAPGTTSVTASRRLTLRP
jgi:virginiamycin B lyase